MRGDEDHFPDDYSPAARRNQTQDSRTKTFLQRQKTQSSEAAIKEQKKTNQVREEARKEAEKKDILKGHLPGFRKLLKDRFGSPVRAWHMALDKDGNGKLTLNEFCDVCRIIGYGKNPK